MIETIVEEVERDHFPEIEEECDGFSIVGTRIGKDRSELEITLSIPGPVAFVYLLKDRATIAEFTTMLHELQLPPEGVVTGNEWVGKIFKGSAFRTRSGNRFFFYQHSNGHMPCFSEESWESLRKLFKKV